MPPFHASAGDRKRGLGHQLPHSQVLFFYKGNFTIWPLFILTDNRLLFKALLLKFCTTDTGREECEPPLGLKVRDS
jgi:hypothetical protein